MPMRTRAPQGLVRFLVVFTLLAAAGGLPSEAAPEEPAPAAPAPVIQVRSHDRARALEHELVSALRRVEPASVTIVGRQPLAAARSAGRPAPLVMEGAGSGVLVRWNGTWVLTNAHVVAQTGTARSGRLEAITSDGKAHSIAVRASDRSVDLAIARFSGSPNGLQPVRVPTKPRLEAGTWVSSAGNPFLLSLEGRPAATVGVISAMRPARHGGYVRVPTVQHDAEINPGNSGGPLWSLGGELLGINGSIATRAMSGGVGPSYTGASFAVPVDAIRNFLTRTLGPDRESAPTTRAAPSALTDLEAEYRRAIQRVIPSAAVCVPYGVTGRRAGFSSGVVVHPSGLVLSDGDAGLVWQREYADGKPRVGRTWRTDVSVRIWHPPSRLWRTYRGRVVYRDRDVDTSLVQLTELPVGGLTSFVPPGRSDNLQPGSITLAVGSAFDEADPEPPSLTAGVVSAVDGGRDGFVYTSAGVNRGVNGGPMVDLSGRLVGTISTYVDPASDEPYGFLGKAVPIDRILGALQKVPAARPLLENRQMGRHTAKGGGALEEVLHNAGRRIRPSLVSIEAQRARAISQSVPLEGKTVKLTRYEGAFSGLVAGDDLVVTSLYNLANLSERVETLWKVPDGARLREGLEDVGRIHVWDPKGNRIEATLVGHDLRWGFALLRTKRKLAGVARPQAAPESAAERGRFLITAGDPFGQRRPIDPLVTMGILSKEHPETAPSPWRGMWQTDAGALDGNVGGAAVDLEGRIVGMLTVWDPAKHGRNSGIGFVIPWSKIQASVPELLAGRAPVRGLMGVWFGRGAVPVIDRVNETSAASRAGVQPGDVIRAVDDQPTPTVLEVLQIVHQRMAGETVRISVERAGRVQTLTLVLGERPQD